MAKERDENGYIKGSAASELGKKKSLGSKFVTSGIIWAIVWVVCFFLLPAVGVPSVPDWVQKVIVVGFFVSPFLFEFGA